MSHNASVQQCKVQFIKFNEYYFMQQITTTTSFFNQSIFSELYLFPKGNLVDCRSRFSQVECPNQDKALHSALSNSAFNMYNI